MLVERLRSWLAEQEVPGSIPVTSLQFSVIGYRQFPSRDILSTAKVFCERPRNRGGVAQKFILNR